MSEPNTILAKDKSILNNYKEAVQHEWLETNGLGGWSGSTVIGTNTRRYHGLLIAAVVPPAERMSLVSKMDETIVIADRRIELGTNYYKGEAIHPNGYQSLSHFNKDLFPQWEYEVDGIKLKKTIAMPHGENTVLVIYEVLEAAQSFTLELLPLLSVRGYHSLSHVKDDINKEGEFSNTIFSIQLYEGKPRIYIMTPGATYHADPQWYLNFNYSDEQYRGLDFEEDLFSPGQFSVQLNKGDRMGIIISADDPAGRDAEELFAKETLRRQKLIVDQPNDQLFKQLLLAADQFVVKRGDDFKTIIAGYHLFTDWGRDTMISLPGLCLSTGRFDDARKILSAFEGSASEGMLPNRFQDNGEEPEYNNVDGTLWYFIAIYKYLKATGEKEFVLNELLPGLKDIIDWHFKGTRYNIKVSEDGLLNAGEKGQQLTWMDAKVEGWVVTPRMGKPVEIQALWYNVLKIFSELLQMNGQAADAIIVNQSAEKAKESFTRLFWNEEAGYLNDVIDEYGEADSTLRPNQLFAISLPFALLEGERAASVLKIVSEQLYTPVGLRTLPSNHPRYIAIYGGDTLHRDAAYHEGTVWSWLLGPYIDAIIKVHGSNEKAREVIDNFSFHLNEGCLGSVSEIFDADAPHYPCGCVAQAWGVAELLRVMGEYELV